MKRELFFIALCLFAHLGLFSQQISKADLIFLTPEWEGERYEDGRPKVPDAILERMKLVTLEEAWAILRGDNYTNQYEEGWMTINPDSVLVGRALTATFMPGRPDVHRVLDKKGHEEDGRIKSQNSWPIDISGIPSTPNPEMASSTTGLSGILTASRKSGASPPFSGPTIPLTISIVRMFAVDSIPLW